MSKNHRIVVIAILFILAVVVTASLFDTRKSNLPAPTQTADQTSNWKTYTNSKSTFSIKLPPSWFVHTDITGNEMVMYYPVDNPSTQNFREEKTITMLVAISPNVEQKTLFEEAEKVKETNSLFFIEDNKAANQNYITLTSKNGRSLMAMTHYQTTTYVFSVNGDVEKNRPTIDQILSSFKIIDPATNDNKSLNYVSAMSILQNVPEIQLLQKDIIRLGRTTFFKAGDENGDVVKIWLYEDGFPDNHTTRIDTFNVNVRTKVITVDDVAMISGKESITLEEWKKTVKERFE